MQQIHWTEPKHNAQHGYAAASPSLANRWVTVQQVGDQARLIRVNAGRVPADSLHDSVADAKAAGERWINESL